MLVLYRDPSSGPYFITKDINISWSFLLSSHSSLLFSSLLLPACRSFSPPTFISGSFAGLEYSNYSFRERIISNLLQRWYKLGYLCTCPPILAHIVPFPPLLLPMRRWREGNLHALSRHLGKLLRGRLRLCDRTRDCLEGRAIKWLG
jgi:hypothetical protein